MRKLATIQKILKVEPIAGADAIEMIQVLGWELVAQKNVYKVGDYCVYCEVDSFLPIKPEFEFLRKSCFKRMSDGSEGFRIRTIRLRGQISSGIAFPLSILENILGGEIIESDNVKKLIF